MDEIKNWFKVNKATGEIEFVHTSGSYFKIDGAGNAVLHLKGSYTEIIEGDSLRQSLNSDETVLAKATKHIVGSLKIIADGAMNIQGATIEEKAAGAFTMTGAPVQVN